MTLLAAQEDLDRHGKVPSLTRCDVHFYLLAQGKGRQEQPRWQHVGVAIDGLMLLVALEHLHCGVCFESRGQRVSVDFRDMK